MLFQIYGETAGWQLLGWLLVFAGLVLANEVARRTPQGGIFCFLILPAGLTVYFISIYVGAAMGAEWALNNPTYTHMNSSPWAAILSPASGAPWPWPPPASGGGCPARTSGSTAAGGTG